MKRLLPYLLVAVCVLSQFETLAQLNNFSVSGSVKGLDTDEMTIRVPDSTVQQHYRMDTIKVVDGKFTYWGRISQLALVTIYPGMPKVVKGNKMAYLPVKSATFILLASPGAKINFTGKVSDFVDAYPSGNATNNDLATLFRKINPLTNKAANMQVRLSGLNDIGPVKDSLLSDSVKVLEEQVTRIKLQFLKSHVNSVAAIWLLSDMMLRKQITSDEAISVFAKMNKNLQNTEYYKDVQRRIEGTRLVKIGAAVPDIVTRSTVDGKLLKLTDFKGKYVLIDFWGTWCVPCMAEMPTLKNYANKFSGKLEVVGIAKESDDGTNWRKTIELRSLHWNQILDNSNDNFVTKFNVSGYPTKILIDPAGIVIGRYVGQTEELFEKLDSLLVK